MEFAQMTIKDYPDVFALWQSCEGEGVCIDEDVDSREGIAAYLQRNRGMSFVAREDGELIGCVLCGTDGRRGYLHHLAVDKACRGNGIGKALIQEALHALAEEGIGICHVFVLKSNKVGKAFWSHLGWVLRDNFTIMSHMPQMTSRNGEKK